MYTNNNPLYYTDPTGHVAIGDSNGEAGCSGHGPACIITMYYAAGDDDGLDRSLEAFARRHPKYNPADDSELAGMGAVIVAAADSRAGCDGGNAWDCVTMGAVSGLFGSPGPANTSGFLTPLNNDTVPMNLIDVYPQPGFDPEARFPNLEVRLWYNSQLKNIDTDGPPTEEFARQVNAQRNALKVQARDLMVDRAEVARLDRDFPIQDFEYYVQKYSAQGYSGEALWERIIQGGTTPNPDVNRRFGIR